MIKYNVVRYEEKSDSLFILICSDHCQVEHFFSEDERKDRKSTIERLVAELEIEEDRWSEPEPLVSRLLEFQSVILDRAAITKAKAEILAKQAESKEPVEEVLVDQVEKGP